MFISAINVHTIYNIKISGVIINYLGYICIFIIYVLHSNCYQRVFCVDNNKCYITKDCPTFWKKKV